MKGVLGDIGTVSGLAWPLVVVFAIVLYRKGIAGVIETIKKRGIAFKAAGVELTLQEAHEQDAQLLADMRKQLLDLERRVEGGRPPGLMLPDAARGIVGSGLAASGAPEGLEARSAQAEAGAKPAGPRSILWVDDNPRNNAALADQLRRMDNEVELALSTNDARRMLASKRYDAVISDMGRTEDGKHRPDAGLDLLKWIRERGDKLPVVFFTTRKTAESRAEDVREAGGTAITSSSFELFRALGL